jgi:hypothetical protein
MEGKNIPMTVNQLSYNNYNPLSTLLASESEP